MSKKNLDDDLPTITLPSTGRVNSKAFPMPCATKLALERAHEEQVEEEIRQLREEYAQVKAGLKPLVQTDSSGSESDMMLSAAETAMKALNMRVVSTAYEPKTLETLVTELRSYVPDSTFLDVFLETVQNLPLSARNNLILDLTRKVTDLMRVSVLDKMPWELDEVLAIGVWLSTANLSCEMQDAPMQVYRAVHLLIDDVATESQVKDLGTVLLEGITDARTRIILSDALRSGGPQAEGLSEMIAHEVIRNLLGENALTEEGVSSAALEWRQLEPNVQYLALQAIGRAAKVPGRRLLSAIMGGAPVTINSTTFKVLISASKMQSLLPNMP